MTDEEARAMRIVHAELKALPDPVDKPFTAQTMGEQLATVTRLGLETIYDILMMPCDPDDRKLLSIKKDAAVQMVRAQIRVDQNKLRGQALDRLPEMLDRLKAIKTEAGTLTGDDPLFLEAEPLLPLDGYEIVGEK